MLDATRFLSPADVQVIVHHSPCADGHAAAAVAYSYLHAILTHGAHPGAPLLTDEVRELIKGRNVLLVDICFSRVQIAEAATLAKSILILDHHVTSEKLLEGSGQIMENVYAHLDMTRAGVHLAWQYFYGMMMEMPRAFDYIGLRDIWKHKNNDNAVCYNIAFKMPEAWRDWLSYASDANTAKVVERGRAIREYQTQVLALMAEKAQVSSWRGYRIALLNAPHPWTSELGELLSETEPAKTVAVIWTKQPAGPFYVSLRSNDAVGPDVEAVAREMGGGGHKHAAGLRLDRPPYEVFSDTGKWEEK